MLMKELISGLLALVALSIALGKYDDLARFARREAGLALSGKSWTPLTAFPGPKKFKPLR
jgi:hypothetical protein